MSDESQKLFEAFIEQHADSRVIAISHHIESLIDDIMKLERRASELAGRGLRGEEIMRKVMAANR